MDMMIEFFLMFNWFDYVLLLVVVILTGFYINYLVTEHFDNKYPYLKPKKESDAYIATMAYQFHKQKCKHETKKKK